MILKLQGHQKFYVLVVEKKVISNLIVLTHLMVSRRNIVPHVKKFLCAFHKDDPTKQRKMTDVEKSVQLFEKLID